MGCASPTAAAAGVEVGKHALRDSEQRAHKAPNGNEAGRRSFHNEFVLAGKLGKGAFAQVYAVRRLASQGGDGEKLAVKIMDLRADRSTKPASETEDVDAKRRVAVEGEASILRKVTHLKHCIQMVDAFVEGCFSYIVMERCDRTLLQTLESFPALNEHTVKRIFRDMLASLASIHALGVVHRDVKPDNFLCLGEHSSVKLCDFGLASLLSGRGQPQLSGVYGTPPFMSPEMLSNFGYDSQTDVWSFGVIAYALLLGQFPYKPAEPSGKAMKAAIKAGVPEPTFRPKPRLEPSGTSSVSVGAQGFLMELLIRSPEGRPAAGLAIQNAWLQEEFSPEDQQCAPSLRPMLYAARRAGAFDPPRGANESDKTGMDHLMAELQARRQRSGTSPLKVPKAPPSSASTDVGSMCTSDRSGQSSADFQAPGTVA